MSRHQSRWAGEPAGMRQVTALYDAPERLSERFPGYGQLLHPFRLGARC